MATFPWPCLHVMLSTYSQGSQLLLCQYTPPQGCCISVLNCFFDVGSSIAGNFYVQCYGNKYKHCNNNIIKHFNSCVRCFFEQIYSTQRPEVTFWPQVMVKNFTSIHEFLHVLKIIMFKYRRCWRLIGFRPKVLAKFLSLFWPSIKHLFYGI